MIELEELWKQEKQSNACISYSQYQEKEIVAAVESFVNKGKRKALIADEVGLGKTYVAQGIIRLMKRVKNKDSFVVYYFAPNESILNENVKDKLLKGISEASHNAERPVLQLSKKKMATGIQVFASSPGITFGDKSRYGTKEERCTMCAALKCALSGTEYEKTLPILYSMLYMPQITGDICNQKGYVVKYQNGNEKVYDWGREREGYVGWINEIDSEYKKIEENNKGFKDYYNSIPEEVFVKDTIDYIEKGVADFYSFMVNLIGYNLKNGNYLDLQKEIIDKTFKDKYPWDGYWVKNIDSKNIKTKQHVKYCFLLGVPFADYYEDHNKQTIRFENVADLFFQEMRRIITEYVFKEIKPDLIILDEFHRYFESEEKKGVEKILEACNETKVLMLSATPYRPKMDEIEVDDSFKNNYILNNAFPDFASVLGYITADKMKGEEKETNEWKKQLDEYYNSIKKLSHFGECKWKFSDVVEWVQNWNDAYNKKNDIENELRDVVIRTERYMAVDQFDEDYIEESESDVELDKQSFLSIAQEYMIVNENHLDYLLSTPFYLSFSKGYKIEANIKKDGIEKLFWDPEEKVEHNKYTTLWKEADCENMCKLLWIPPSGMESKGVFKNSKDITKTLVFCRFVMSTRAIAALISKQIEKLLTKINLEKYGDDKSLEEKGEKLRNSIEEFDVKVLFPEPLEEDDFYNACLKIDLKKYFKNNIDVLLAAGVTDLNSLLNYCKDGNLIETLREYWSIEKENFIQRAKKALACDGMNIRYQSRDSFQKNGKVNSTEKYEVIKCHYSMRLTDDYNDGSEADSKGIDDVKDCFQSPFWPFVLATTSIAQEGIDLHYYCHRIYHWSIPISPVEYDQREGRINRRQSHLVRKRKYYYDEKKLDEETQNCIDRSQGMMPDWYIPKRALAGCKSIPMAKRIVSFYPLSKEEGRYRILMGSLLAYRLSLGCGVDFGEAKELLEVCEKMGRNPMDLLLHLSPAFAGG